MKKVKIQPQFLKYSTPEQWKNHRVCPHCGYSRLLMDGFKSRTCPLCGLDFNISTGLKP